MSLYRVIGALGVVLYASGCGGRATTGSGGVDGSVVPDAIALDAAPPDALPPDGLGMPEPTFAGELAITQDDGTVVETYGLEASGWRGDSLNIPRVVCGYATMYDELRVWVDQTEWFLVLAVANYDGPKTYAGNRCIENVLCGPNAIDPANQDKRCPEGTVGNAMGTVRFAFTNDPNGLLFTPDSTPPLPSTLTMVTTDQGFGSCGGGTVPYVTLDVTVDLFCYQDWRDQCGSPGCSDGPPTATFHAVAYCPDYSRASEGTNLAECPDGEFGISEQ